MSVRTIETSTDKWECEDCKALTNTRIDGVPLCRECHEKRKEKILQERGNPIKGPADFKNWKSEDISDLFWMHLAAYQKSPNRKNLSVIERIMYWTQHADHGLCNSFTHALNWIGIDNIHMERIKWDRGLKS